MFNTAAEKTASQLILVGAPFTTVFLLTGSVTDPVNATKLAAAGALGFSLFALILFSGFKALVSQYKTTFIFAGLFALAGISAAVNSSSPLTQNIYGSFGRNTGLLTYLILTLILLGTLFLQNESSFKKIIIGLQVAGIVNVIYCAWVIAFGDFLSWSNPYGNLLGFFGNPNFISAFLGIFISTIFALVAAPKKKLGYRLTGIAVALIAFYEVLDSNAIQGIVVTAGGMAIVGFFMIRTYLKSNILSSIYVLAVSALGILALLGALQKGPFTFIYKTSVSLRGAYWNAGLKMGFENPLTGVGMDSYGDWYRRARSENAALVLPGPGVVTNAAHNVVIDLFAFGGFPLLLSYLGMIVLAGIASFKIIRRSKEYDAVFVAMFAGWACYQVQSLISINQVGLAIWGWILTGALIAYEKLSRSHELDTSSLTQKKSKSKQVRSASVISPQLVAGLGVVVGLLVAVPPMSADTKWRSALDSKDANKVLAALEPGYLNPSDSQRYAQAVQLFGTSNLMDQARQIALTGTQFNPDYFDAWRLLFALSNSTEEEKALALENMKRLDPLNPDVTS
jgi:O-antigen ligase